MLEHERFPWRNESYRPLLNSEAAKILKIGHNITHTQKKSFSKIKLILLNHNFQNI